MLRKPRIPPPLQALQSEPGTQAESSHNIISVTFGQARHQLGSSLRVRVLRKIFVMHSVNCNASLRPLQTRVSSTGGTLHRLHATTADWKRQWSAKLLCRVPRRPGGIAATDSSSGEWRDNVTNAQECLSRYGTSSHACASKSFSS